VQYVCRPQDSANPELHDYRGFMGRVEAGEIKVGDAVTVLPSGRESTVKAVQIGGVDIGEAFSRTIHHLLLADEIDTSRGDMIVKSSEVPEQSSRSKPPSAGWPNNRWTAPAPT
jgi:sulfate adenylyltransferase subunit 1